MSPEPQYPVYGSHHIFCPCRSTSHTFRDHFYNIFRHDNPPSKPFCYWPSPKYYRPPDRYYLQRRPREYYDPTTIPEIFATSAPCNVPSGLRSPQRYSEHGFHTCFSPAVPIPELPAWNHRSPPPVCPALFPPQALPPVPFRKIFLRTVLRFRIQSRRHVSRVHYRHTERNGLLQSRKKQAAVLPDPDDKQFRYPAQQQSQISHVLPHYAIVPAPVPVPLPAASCSFPVK